MEQDRSPSPPVTALRRQAERRLERKLFPYADEKSRADIRGLIHELEVRQAGLERQKEELRQAQAKGQETLQEYTELFDFAPVAYFVLDDEPEMRKALRRLLMCRGFQVEDYRSGEDLVVMPLEQLDPACPLENME